MNLYKDIQYNLIYCLTKVSKKYTTKLSDRNDSSKNTIPNFVQIQILDANNNIYSIPKAIEVMF